MSKTSLSPQFSNCLFKLMFCSAGSRPFLFKSKCLFLFNYLCFDCFSTSDINWVWSTFYWQKTTTPFSRRSAKICFTYIFVKITQLIKLFIKAKCIENKDSRQCDVWTCAYCRRWDEFKSEYFSRSKIIPWPGHMWFYILIKITVVNRFLHISFHFIRLYTIMLSSIN